MKRTESWYQLNGPGGPGDPVASKDNIKLSPSETRSLTRLGSGRINQAGDQGQDQDEPLEELIEEQKAPLEVKRKNKIICTVAYIILISSLIAYIAAIGVFNSEYGDIAEHYLLAICSIYVIFSSDIIAGFIGIWTCLAKTGPKPMIAVCVWMMISGLANICASISLAYEDNALVVKRGYVCKAGSENSGSCRALYTIDRLLWFSMIFILAKLIVIALCRFNYPRVFNWLAGRDVLVDEELIQDNSSNLSKAEKVGGAFLAPVDVRRLTARGALGGTVRKSADSQTIFVLKNDENFRPEEHGSANAMGENFDRKKRRSTLVSIGKPR